MDKAKEIVNDPAKLEEALKQAWKKLDPEGKGFTSYDICFFRNRLFDNVI